MSWILGEVPYSKRIVTIEQGCREFDLTAVDEEGNVLNNVVHLVTRFSDDPRQNIDMVKLLETTLTINPDCIAVAEMKGEYAGYQCRQYRAFRDYHYSRQFLRRYLLPDGYAVQAGAAGDG